MGLSKEEMTALAKDEFVADALAKYEAPLIGYATGIVRDHERARDVVQDTFIRLYKQDIEKVQKGLKTWLYTVCRNRALDVLSCLLYTSPSPRDQRGSRMPSSA